jgi:small multidrug resistance pump
VNTARATRLICPAPPPTVAARFAHPSSEPNPQRSHSPVNVVYLIIAIVAEVAGTTALKASDGFTRLLPSVVVVCSYGVAFFFLSLTLRSMPVGIAYAIWSGLGIVLISAAAYVFYRQSLDLPAMIGIALIMAGVVTVNLFSNTAGH